MRYNLSNAFVKSWSTSGDVDGDTFDFNFTTEEPDPQAVGMLLPAVQQAREAARSTDTADIPVETMTMNFEKIEWDESAPHEIDDFLF